jgi:hypothetical protein
MKSTIGILLGLVFLIAQAATFQLHHSERDAQGNLICTYQNGESINMGKSNSACPSSVSR